MSNKKTMLGIIGGSGFYDIKYLLDNNQVDGRLKMCKIFNEFFK